MRTLLTALAATVLTATVAAARIGGGELAFEVPKEGNVIFSHEAHVVTASLGCTQCHDKLYLTRGQHRKTSMMEMQKGKSCGDCHDGKKAFGVKENCNNCHAKEAR